MLVFEEDKKDAQLCQIPTVSDYISRVCLLLRPGVIQEIHYISLFLLHLERSTALNVFFCKAQHRAMKMRGSIIYRVANDSNPHISVEFPR